MTTIGKKLMDEARRGKVSLTEHYWGSKISYEGPGHYEVLHFRQGFGGMKVYRRSRVSVSALRACDSLELLEEILQPENDHAAGDPLNYMPRDVRRVSLTWRP